MSTLLQNVEAFIEARGLSESQFGTEALNDKNLVRDLRKGRRLWPETETKVLTFMAAYRPNPTERAA